MSLDNELELAIEACAILDGENEKLRKKNAELKAQVEQLRNDLTEAADILENELLPNLDDTYPLVEMINSFRSSACTQSDNHSVAPFAITAQCHPARHSSFKNGIWYGCIDGREITAPRHDKNSAIEDARSMLYGSGYLAHLQTHCDTIERRKTPSEKETVALASLRAALEKYERLACLKLNEVCQSTPAQCLAEVKAQAGRDGFIAGIRLRSKGSCNDWQKAGEEYANQLRQQAKGGE